MPERLFRVAVWPEYSGANPYLDLFYHAVEPLGIRVVGILTPDLRWLDVSARSVDGIHIHWPEKLWRRTGHTWAAHASGLRSLHQFLGEVQRRDIRILWTFHNAGSHEGSSVIDRFGYRLLTRKADLVICHSQTAARAVRGAKRLVVMPHGSYEGVYPRPRSRASVLSELDLKPDLPVLAIVGLLRPYKGLAHALEAVSQLEGRVQLVIAGPVHRQFDASSVERSAARIAGCRVLPRLLNEQEFADIVGASEAVLLPYTKITGSGALLAAWTLGRGVIASALPFFEEMLGRNGEAGHMFKPCDASSLAEAITKYLQIPAERRRKAALARSAQYRWERCVEPLRPILDDWCRRSVSL